MTDTPVLPDPEPVAPPARRSSGRIIALAVAIVAVIGGAAFAAVSLANNGNSPEDPVRAMLEAAQHGDAVGVMEQLDPAERDAIRGPLNQLTAQLNRLGVLKDADLSHVTGVDLKINDLQLESKEVRDGLARVRIVSGTSKYTVDPDKFPLGKFVRDLAGDKLKDAVTSGTGDLKSKKPTDFVTTIKRGDRWYVSIGYSVAEAAREDQHMALADLGNGVPARGADSPEAAVHDLLIAGTKLDVRRMIELLPPDEMAALHAYAGMFIDDAEKSIDQVRDKFSIDVPTLDLESDVNGDHALVTVKKIAFDGHFGDASLTYKDGCVDLTPPSDLETGAAASPVHFCSNMDPTQIFKEMGINDPSLQPPDFSFAHKHPHVGFVTTKVDGKWYVSPSRTVLEDVVEWLKIVEPSDLDKGRDWFQQLMDNQRKSVSSD